jgi:TnpA family transposase
VRFLQASCSALYYTIEDLDREFLPPRGDRSQTTLMAARHLRYGRTGGIAYRHVCDNYIALFSRFIGCGIYEATYILDILHNTPSEIHPTRLYADSHGQSAHVFALAYLLGIELLPRILRK